MVRQDVERGVQGAAQQKPAEPASAGVQPFGAEPRQTDTRRQDKGRVQQVVRHDPERIGVKEPVVHQCARVGERHSGNERVVQKAAEREQIERQIGRDRAPQDG